MDPEASPRDGHVHPTFWKGCFEAVADTLSFFGEGGGGDLGYSSVWKC